MLVRCKTDCETATWRWASIQRVAATLYALFDRHGLRRGEMLLAALAILRVKAAEASS